MLDSKAATPQPPPHSGKVTVIDYVMADMAERAAAGVQKYVHRYKRITGEMRYGTHIRKQWIYACI